MSTDCYKMFHLSSCAFLLSVCTIIMGVLADISQDQLKPEPLPERLFRLDPIKIGFERVLELEPGKMFNVLTMSTKPPVFEINNFLSDYECDHIMQLALEEGLDNSTVLEDPRTRFMGSHDAEETETVTQDIDDHILGMFKEFDWSEDGLLDAREILDILPPDGNAFMSINEVVEMILDLGLDKNSDGYLDLNEYKLTSEVDVRRWMRMKMDSDKTRVVRASKQVWLSQNDIDDPVLKSLRDRVVALTRLPRILISGSELLQVVKYSVGGHYHAHYDSEGIDSNMSCHHTLMDEEDEEMDDVFYHDHRICRYLTILYYLNDVDEGGQTAFPLAGNETIDDGEFSDNVDIISDLSHHCKDAKLVIEPKKGKAVMWYNHHLDETGWMGDVDEFSLHGGCDVHSGTKWIANNWINIDNMREKQQEYHEFLLKTFYHQELKESRVGEQEDNVSYEEEHSTNHIENEVTTKDADGIDFKRTKSDNFKEMSKNSYTNDEL